MSHSANSEASAAAGAMGFALEEKNVLSTLVVTRRRAHTYMHMQYYNMSLGVASTMHVAQPDHGAAYFSV